MPKVRTVKHENLLLYDSNSQLTESWESTYYVTSMAIWLKSSKISNKTESYKQHLKSLTTPKGNWHNFHLLHIPIVSQDSGENETERHMNEKIDVTSSPEGIGAEERFHHPEASHILMISLNISNWPLIFIFSHNSTFFFLTSKFDLFVLVLTTNFD